MRYVLSFECELADAYQVLGDLREALFTFMSEEPRPVDQILIDLLQGLLIVLAQLHLERSNATTMRVSPCLTQIYIVVLGTFISPEEQPTKPTGSTPCCVHSAFSLSTG